MASKTSRPAKVVPILDKKPESESSEPTHEQLMQHIAGMQQELADAHREIGELTLKNKRQTYAISELRMRLELAEGDSNDK